jgi:hypothetical protein
LVLGNLVVGHAKRKLVLGHAMAIKRKLDLGHVRRRLLVWGHAKKKLLGLWHYRKKLVLGFHRSYTLRLTCKMGKNINELTTICEVRIISYI